MFSIQAVRATQFTEVFNNLQMLVKRGLIDPELGTLPKQAQLLTEHCMGLTPPRDNRNRYSPGSVAKNQHQKMGENAVARDINSIIAARSIGYLESVIQITGKTDNISQILRNKKGVTYAIDVNRIDVDGGRLSDFHRKNRDTRGRVLRATSKSNDAVIGRWKNRDRMWTTPDALDAYRKKKMAMVGWAKAGWLKAYLALGGKRAPAWVTRHGTSAGSYTNGLNTSRPFIAVGNGTRWGSGAGANAAMLDAFQGRTKAMQTYFNTMMRLASEGKPTQWQAKAQAAAAQEAA